MLPQGSANTKKYSVATPDGVARIYTMSYSPSRSLRSTPDRSTSRTNQPTPTASKDSGYLSRSNISGSKGNISPPSTPSCMPFSKKSKRASTPNRNDAYVFMDTEKDRFVILDDGKPFEIPVKISGKYSITNTTSKLSITILKNKFGNRSRSPTSAGNKDKLSIEKRTLEKGTCSDNKQCCGANESGKFSLSSKKSPNAECGGGKAPCYCKKCKVGK